MAQSNYDGEIKSSMAEKPKSKPPKGKPSSGSRGPPSGAVVASGNANGNGSARPNQPPVAAVAEEPQAGMASPSFGSGGGGAHSPAHAAMAASIAHAILQKGGQ